MRSIIIKSMVVLAFSFACLLAFAAYQIHQFLDRPMNIPAEGIEFQLPRGGALSSAAYDLYRQGILTHPRWLTLYSRLSRRGQSVHAGDYWLEPRLTPRQWVAKLEAGDVRYFQVTIVEGSTVTQILQQLRNQPRLAQTLTGDTVTTDQLGVDWARSLEGMFFPDTYRFHSGDSDVSILKQAFNRMQVVLEQEWADREPGLPYENAYEALIMASLVEKETGFAPERPQIAGVFVRRLHKGMRLQTDPTIIYGLGNSFDGNLRSRHLKDASNKYNTYRHHGLTPTPIAAAGREAIHAALHPEKGDTLYFVAKGDGSHYFSRTLEEHQRAVRKYQIEQREKNYSSSPPPGAFIPATVTRKQDAG